MEISTQPKYSLIKLSALVLLFASGGGCIKLGSPQSSNVHIKGGRLISDSQDPIAQRTVLLTATVPNKGRRPICSAVLIQNDIVLTAAHCFSGSNRASLRVEFVTAFAPQRFGSPDDDATTAAFRRKLKRLIVHNGFSEDAALGGTIAASNDLALFTFDGELPPGYTPATLNTDDESLEPTLELAGFGMTENNAPQTTGTLKSVAVPVFEKDAYRKIIVTQNNDADPSGAMPGDSGGPAFNLRNGSLEVAGILSTGTSLAGRFLGKNTYTSVAQHQQWIAKSIKTLRDPTIRVEPVQGLSALAEKANDQLYAIIIINKESQPHWCSFQLSASVIFPGMEKTSVLQLQPTRESADASPNLSLNVPASENDRTASIPFYAKRPVPGRPVRNMMLTTQCDDAPSGPAQKVLLSDELEREIEAAGR